MIGLETPVLVHLLEGGRWSGALLQRLRGQEVATTEVNLFELGALAEAPGAAKRSAARRGAVEMLRKRLTVLPIDSATSKAAHAMAVKDLRGLAEGTVLVLGALHAAGCREVIVDGRSYPRTAGPVRLTQLGSLSPSKG